MEIAENHLQIIFLKRSKIKNVQEKNLFKDATLRLFYAVLLQFVVSMIIVYKIEKERKRGEGTLILSQIFYMHEKMLKINENHIFSLQKQQ